VLRTQASRLEKAGRQLIDMANRAGGPDNISVILIRISEAKQGKVGLLSRLFGR